MSFNEPLIPQHGGYRKLKSFQIAQLVYDFTVDFCSKYIDKHSRTYDQMVQAARSGVQYIAEGSQVSGTSKKTEIKLTNVAWASLEELRLDYDDYLRQHRLPVWNRIDPRRQALVDARCKTIDEVLSWIQHQKKSGQNGLSGLHPSETTSRLYISGIAANTALVLIAIACILLDRQISAQTAAFEKEGGFTERLYRIRTTKRMSY